MFARTSISLSGIYPIWFHHLVLIQSVGSFKRVLPLEYYCIKHNDKEIYNTSLMFNSHLYLLSIMEWLPSRFPSDFWSIAV